MRRKCDPGNFLGLADINLKRGSDLKLTALRDTAIGFGEEGKTVCPTGSGAVVKTIM